MDTDNDIVMLKRKQVEAMTSLPRSSLYAKMQAEDFPRPVKIGSRSVRWIQTDVIAWINSRIAASRGNVVTDTRMDVQS